MGTPIPLFLDRTRVAIWMVALLWLPAIGLAQSFRIWDAEDQSFDSYIDGVAIDPEGLVWVTHGRDQPISVLDGYRTRRIEPPSTTDGVLAVGPEEAWLLDFQGVQRFNEGRWKLYAVSQIAELRSDARLTVKLLSLASGRVLIMLPDRLLLLNAALGEPVEVLRSDQTKLGAFSAIGRALDGSVWVGSQFGVSRLRFRGTSLGYSVAESFQFPANDIGSADELSFGPDGEVLVVAWFRDLLGRVVLRLDNRRWTRLSSSDSLSLRVWRSPDGLIVMQDGQILSRLVDGEFNSLANQPTLAVVNDAVQESDGTVWIGTTDGLVRFGGSTWAVPSAASSKTPLIHAAVEDAAGALWFAAHDKLLTFVNQRWRNIELPNGLKTYELHTDGLVSLPGNKLIMKTQKPRELLSYDTRQGHFESISHPEDRMFRLISPHSDGRVWVNTSSVEDRFDQRLEVYDGEQFEIVLDRGPNWEIGRMRTVWEDPDGTVWIGGTMGLARWSGAEYDVWAEPDGFGNDGAYAILRDSQNRLLVGGRNGIQEFDGEKWIVVAADAGKIRSLIETSDGSVWAAGDKGVHRELYGSWFTVTAADGLPSSRAYELYVDSHNRLWVGTARGVSLYDPNADKDPPIPFVEDQYLDGAQLLVGGGALIRFSGVDKWKQTSSSRLMFSSSLDGQPWTALSNKRTVSLEGLAAGSHEIRLRAVDRAGNLGTLDTPYRFEMLNPWYLRSGFLLVFLLGSGTILFLAATVVKGYFKRGHLIDELDASVSASSEAMRRADEASRLKGEFLANMSHEIRTPISVIMGMTELTLQADLHEKEREHLSMAMTNASSLLRIIDDVLDFSKIEAGRLTLESAEFNILELIDRLSKYHREQAQAKDISFSCEVDSRVPSLLLGDQVRLEQVLNNLVGNAIKFTAEGRVEVAVAIQTQTAEDVHLHFTVSDTGVGIATDKRDLVLESFTQVDGSSTRRFGGTGLGLAIVNRLAAAMGGEFWFESLEGVGSKFYFTARLARTEELRVVPFERSSTSGGLGLQEGERHHVPSQPNDPSEAVIPTTAISDGAHARARILIVEDKDDNRALAVRMVKKMGHAVVEAANGKEALDALDRSLFDVVLMDIQMPVMNGVEATSEIRRRERPKKLWTPIVAITAYAIVGDRERFLQAGMDHYLAKPFSFDELRNAIDRAIESRDETRPRREDPPDRSAAAET